ncbi:MAG: hypothetical protein K8U03_09805 [Planctomycetia bacterium]|nr:hypothetical protein [Planctomycetia bacterium]
MARALKKPAELRDSWRPRLGTDRQGRWLRFGRRLGMTFLVGLLFAAMYYALFSPFWHPHTHLITAGVERFRDTASPALEFVREDAAAMQVPLDAVLFHSSADDRTPRHLETADDFAGLAARLNADDVRPEDVLVLYLQTHGVGLDGDRRGRE